MTSTSSKRSKKTRFLSGAEIDEAVNEIAEIAEDGNADRGNVRVALIGGCAMQVYGSDRLTMDVDIAAESELDGLHPVGDLRTCGLTFGGYHSRTPSGVPVDVVLRDDEYTPLYQAAIESTLVFDDIALPVVDPNYLAALKMAAGRDKDRLDLEYLITSGETDDDEVKKVVGKYLGVYAVREFEQIAKEARWKADQKK